MDINIKLESNNKIIEIGKGKLFRLLSIEGISSGDNWLNIERNTFNDGSRVRDKKVIARSILAEIEYVGGGKADKRKQLAAFFNVHNEGRFIIDINGTEQCINYDVESFKANLVNVNKPLKFLISLYCPDPYFKDLEETREDVSTEVGNFEFPLHIPVEGLELSIRTISFITNIYNEGDSKTPIRVMLRATGTVTNPVITNLSTGEYIMVKRTLSKGDVLEINTEFGNKRVEIIREDGSKENAFNYIDYKSTFFSIDSGDTEIEYGAEVGDNNLDVYIYYTPRYLGV